MLKKTLMILLSLSLLLSVPGVCTAAGPSSSCGLIALFPYTFTPKGWLSCDGQLLEISRYSTLYSLLGNQFGGNGTTTFALPHLNKTSNDTGRLHANPADYVRYYIQAEGQIGESSEEILGEIVLFPTFAMNILDPSGSTYLPCDGRLMSISQNSALFSLLGAVFGGDGRSSFALPDLSQCAPMTNIGSGPAESHLTYYIVVVGYYPSNDGSDNSSYLGSINLYPYTVGNNGSHLTSMISCYGNMTLQPILQNQALFSLIGTNFGGDGRVSFGVPDLSGAVPADRLYYGMVTNAIFPSHD